ncbi:hypothetical protein VPH35_130409 [Triticum aestivum]
MLLKSSIYPCAVHKKFRAKTAVFDPSRCSAIRLACSTSVACMQSPPPWHSWTPAGRHLHQSWRRASPVFVVQLTHFVPFVGETVHSPILPLLGSVAQGLPGAVHKASACGHHRLAMQCTSVL